jgi:hypothetical protein
MEVVKVEKNEIEEMGRKIIRDEAGSIIYELKVILAKTEIGQVGGNNSMLSKEITIIMSFVQFGKTEKVTERDSRFIREK